MKKIMRVMIAVVLCAAFFSCATSGGSKDTAKSQIVLVNEAEDRSVTIKYRSGKEKNINLKKDVPVSITVPSGEAFTITHLAANMKFYNYNVPPLYHVRLTLTLKVTGVDHVGRTQSEFTRTKIESLENKPGFPLEVGPGRVLVVDFEKAVKSAFNALDPVFQQNLKPNAEIAVFPVSTWNFEESEAIYDQLQINLSDSNKYSMVEKRKTDALLDEYDFQKSGEVGVLTIGELLGADAVVFGSITGRDGDWQMVLIAVDVAKRATLAIVKEKL